MPSEVASEPSLSGQTDDALVSLIEAGQAEEALRELEHRYGTKVFGFVNGLLRDAHLAQDATQEVFEKVFLKTSHYQRGTNFRAWLFEIARNQALSTLRAQQRSPRPVSSLRRFDDEAGDPLGLLPEERGSRAAEEREFMDAFNRCVHELPSRYQRVFDLCVRQGKSYQDAGQVLGIPTGTVAIRIMRARQRLFQALSRHVDRIRRPPACFQV
jgi:RNA polymerase sigma-70 factor (ECF subfamily)